MDKENEYQNRTGGGKMPPPAFRGMRNRVFGLLRNLGSPLLFSLVWPLAVFYGLRALGFNALVSLLLGGLPVAGFLAFQSIKNRKIGFRGGGMFLILGISATLSLVTGNARFMLAKAGFLTAIIGIGFLWSVILKKPVAYTIASWILRRMEVSKSHLDALWAGHREFRRVWKVATMAWGLGILCNALIVIAMAFLLPVDIVPVLNTFVHLILFVVLQVGTHRYYTRKGIWHLVFSDGMG